MSKFNRYLVTSALPYANGPVHIGHLAGVYIPSDIYVRFLRLKGEDVLSVCGSDEHGVPITIKARQEGVTPQDIVDKYHNIIKKAFDGFGINFDIYSRTTSSVHSETASDFFRKLYDSGKFIEQTTQQYYDSEANQFLADRYITGTCPHCKSDGAYGDQCEKCGTTLNATDLIDPKSAITGAKPELKETTHWYLPLNEYDDFLNSWILEGHKEWKPNVYGQCKSWLDMGLQPRAVSRDLNWGIPVPVDGAEGKVLYVWFDAPIGYISATKELTSDWEKYWKSDDTKMIHFIGKDNIVFHCIVFPAMLKAHGDYILPENVPANEFLNLEGDKISTSKNWAVWLHEYLEDFPNKQDVLRYVLCANAPETKDNDFTWKDFQARNNNELVAILGNFVNRAMVLTNKYYDGVIPICGELTDFDKECINEIGESKASLENNINNYKFREALKDAMNIARVGNKYLADMEPWKLVKIDAKRVETIMNIAMQITANIAIGIEPFLPFTAHRITNMLNIDKINWDQFGSMNILSAGTKINSAELLFDKIEDDVVEYQLKKLADTKAANLHNNAFIEPLKPMISFEDFSKLDIRISKIIDAQKVPKTQKLLKLTVDTGLDIRTIVSGIAEYYSPVDLIGKDVVVLANLEPRSLKGIESKGMILMANSPLGEMKLLGSIEDISIGSSVR